MPSWRAGSRSRASMRSSIPPRARRTPPAPANDSPSAWPRNRLRSSRILSMSMPVIRRLESIGPQELAGLCDVLIDCVEGGASVNFMWPMTRAKAERYWRDVAGSLARGERALVIAEDDQGEIMGTAQAVWAGAENQPHR